MFSTFFSAQQKNATCSLYIGEKHNFANAETTEHSLTSYIILNSILIVVYMSTSKNEKTFLRAGARAHLNLFGCAAHALNEHTRARADAHTEKAKATHSRSASPCIKTKVHIYIYSVRVIIYFYIRVPNFMYQLQKHTRSGVCVCADRLVFFQKENRKKRNHTICKEHATTNHSSRMCNV